MASLSPQQHRSRFGDTTLTKVFVGGLAWETPTEELRGYFEQFGDILEAVIITDKNTGRSKGYGFVTFRDPESAQRSVSEPNPIIDGRRTNCKHCLHGPASAFSSSRNQPRGIQQGPQQASGPPYARVPAQMPPVPPVYYPTAYGYMPYTSDYGYQQGMYNPYYHQVYGAPAAASPSAATAGPHQHPYPYMGYMHSPRVGYQSPFQMNHAPYIQYQTAQVEGSFTPSLPYNFQLHAPPNSRQPQDTTTGIEKYIHSFSSLLEAIFHRVHQPYKKIKFELIHKSDKCLPLLNSTIQM